MTTNDSKTWFYQPSASMLNSSILALKRGDVIYSDDKVRSMPWGAIKDWKGIQILEYSFVASSVILLKSVSGKLTSSKEIVLSGPNLDSLIKTDKNWSGYEIISDQNATYIVVKHQDIDGRTEIGPQINMSHSDFVQLKKNAAMNVYA
jgi:hypothetical protein